MTAAAGRLCSLPLSRLTLIGSDVLHLLHLLRPVQPGREGWTIGLRFFVEPTCPNTFVATVLDAILEGHADKLD